MFQMPGRLPEAARHFEAALRAKPDYVDAHANLAAALLQVPGRTSEAIAHYEAALRIKAAIRARLPASSRVHVVGVGSAPNRSERARRTDSKAESAWRSTQTITSRAPTAAAAIWAPSRTRCGALVSKSLSFALAGSPSAPFTTTTGRPAPAATGYS